MAEYTISMDQPNRPKGDPIELPPIGVIPNGSSVTIDLEREQAALLAASYGVTVESSGGKAVKAASHPVVPADLAITARLPVEEVMVETIPEDQLEELPVESFGEGGEES